MTQEQEALIRSYAAGKTTWHDLREQGFEDFIQVLGGLGELGLRLPRTPEGGPNQALIERGRALVRRALAQAASRDA